MTAETLFDLAEFERVVLAATCTPGADQQDGNTA